MITASAATLFNQIEYPFATYRDQSMERFDPFAIWRVARQNIPMPLALKHRLSSELIIARVALALSVTFEPTAAVLDASRIFTSLLVKSVAEEGALSSVLPTISDAEQLAMSMASATVIRYDIFFIKLYF